MKTGSSAVGRAGIGGLALLLMVAGCSKKDAGGGLGGYWSFSCVTGDDQYLVGGGDHAALIELGTGKSVDRISSMVKAVGCGRAQATVVGFDQAWTLPGKAQVTPAPAVNGEPLGLSPSGEWVSFGRKTVAGKWKGPPTLFISGGASARQSELLPSRFGKIGEARNRPTPDSFAVRFGNLVDDGRLVVACGWEPSSSGARIEDVPWGFFAVDLHNGEASPMSLPLKSDAQLNQLWLQRIAASPDGMHLVIAAHDGEQLAIARFDQGANVASRVTGQSAKGSVSAVAISDDGTLIAVGTESRGSDAPAQARVIDQAGKVIWTVELKKTVIGLHFLGDNSLIVAGAEARAIRVALPSGVEKWRTP